MKETTVLIWTDLFNMIVVDVDFRLTYPMSVLLWFIATVGGATMKFFQSPNYLTRVYRIDCCIGPKDPLARNYYPPPCRVAIPPPVAGVRLASTSIHPGHWSVLLLPMPALRPQPCLSPALASSWETHSIRSRPRLRLNALTMGSPSSSGCLPHHHRHPKAT